MRIFKVTPEIYQCDTIAEFADLFTVTPDDLVFTIEVIYHDYLADTLVQDQVIFMDRYSQEEPTDVMIDQILKEIDLSKTNRIIAIGGGACMDVAKIIAVANGSDIDTLFEHKDNIRRVMELILVPTTCGTGSEVTDISAVNRTRYHSKMGLSAPAMAADKVCLIPILISRLPQYVFATSSIDALIHAAESYLSPNATPYSRIFSEYAIDQILTNYLAITERHVARDTLSESFLLASTAAGIAFSIGGCAAVHAMSYQLGGKYHVPHGESNYVMFTSVLEYYDKKHAQGRIRLLKQRIAAILSCPETEVFDALTLLLDRVITKKSLREYGVEHSELEQFADNIMSDQRRLTRNNYVPLEKEDYEILFEALY